MRVKVLLSICFLVLTGCTGAGKEEVSPPPDQPVKLQFWVQWTGEVLPDLERIIDRFEEANPGVTVELVPGAVESEKLLAAISGRNPPDVVASFKVEDLGRYCSSGAWLDLSDRITTDRLDLGMFPQVGRTATSFEGKQCGLPYMADSFGLYYNSDLLAAAGYSEPPRTFNQLSEMAKKLTKFNPDGSIDVAGFVPLVNWYQNYVVRFPPVFDAAYVDGSGESAFAVDPDWADFFNWQRDLIEFYGYDKIARFAAQAGDEFSADQAFQRGNVAMAVDGEWRAQQIEKHAPGLNYGTSPLPVSNRHPDLYGAGHVTVGFVLMPDGAKHPDEAWRLMKFLATDTDALVDWANRLRNIPTTKAALASPQLSLGEHIGPFLEIYAHPRSSFPAVLPQGRVYMAPLNLLAEQWQSGKVTDLSAALRELDEQVNARIKRGG